MKRNRVKPSSKVESASGGKKGKGSRIHVLITRDDETTFSAVALNLPGVGSCGENEAEAIENLREAARGALETYAESGGKIPWKDSSGAEIPADAKQKWIVVQA